MRMCENARLFGCAANAIQMWWWWHGMRPGSDDETLLSGRAGSGTLTVSTPVLQGPTYPPIQMRKVWMDAIADAARTANTTQEEELLRARVR